MYLSQNSLIYNCNKLNSLLKNIGTSEKVAPITSLVALLFWVSTTTNHENLCEFCILEFGSHRYATRKLC